MFNRLFALIPGRAKGSTVVRFFELLRKLQNMIKRDFSGWISHNEKALSSHEESLERAGGFVEDQRVWKDLHYGKCTMSYSGCEVFAAFNAARAILGKELMPLPEMINAFEKDGMVLSGKFGTSPRAVVDFFNRNGFEAELTTDAHKFHELSGKSDSLILTFFNDVRDIRKQVHTVNVSKDERGFTAHNVYCNGRVVGPYLTLDELIKSINDGKAKAISLVGIKKKNKGEKT